MRFKQLEQVRVDELYAVARAMNNLLTGKAKKAELHHYVWFYEQVTDILARAMLDGVEHDIRAQSTIPREPLTDYEKNLLEYILTRNVDPVIKEAVQQTCPSCEKYEAFLRLSKRRYNKLVLVARNMRRF